jgi:hypothetical protein
MYAINVLDLYGYVRSYKPYFFSQRTVFFSYSKSANSTFSQVNRAKDVFGRAAVATLFTQKLFFALLSK